MPARKRANRSITEIALAECWKYQSRLIDVFRQSEQFFTFYRICQNLLACAPKILSKTRRQLLYLGIGILDAQQLRPRTNGAFRSIPQHFRRKVCIRLGKLTKEQK
jgi:hypothetical protein